MDTDDDRLGIPLQLASGCVVASVQTRLDERVLARFRDDLLERIRSTRAHGVVIDLSVLDLLDPHEFEALRATSTMARVLGARTILVGLQPGVVSSLVDLGVDTDGVTATHDVAHALEILGPPRHGADAR